MTSLRIVWAALLAAGISSTALATTVFDNRQNVNVLNAENAVITAAQVLGSAAPIGSLRANYLDGTFVDGGSNPPGGVNNFTINFNASRNIKTIRSEFFSGSEMNAATVETSNDGISYTPQSASFASSGTTRTITLDSAVNAQYLRVTATDIADGNGTNRLVTRALRVFGDNGTLVDLASNIDLVSGTGFTNPVTMSLSNMSITDTTTSEFVNDALNPIKRQVLFNVSTGDSLVLQLSGPYALSRFGIYHAAHFAGNDLNMSFTVETSLDGVSYSNVLNQTGLPLHMNYFALSPSIGQYVRVTFTNVNHATNDERISDLQIFGAIVPEPTTLTLALASLLTLIGFCRHSRRKTA